MRKKSRKILAALLSLAAVGCLYFAAKPLVVLAEIADYGELYRNQLTYSALRGWNNDPNGLVYADGTYHMYYQYTYNRETGETQNYWADMSWGHAVSTDLVHWEEKPVAIPAYQTVDGVYYPMMFSGSCVYDEGNTSGLFDVDENGKLLSGQGIVAVLTQPSDDAGGQRQILAYSKNGGDSFTIYGEVLGADEDGGLDDGEFRDPKVFRYQDTWLMVVGGGSVRMYSSEDLLDWTYLGETGYWGECPDISFYEVGGEEKAVLALSPEDKENSHDYNGTNRENYYYPSEYYVVGSLDENMLFQGESELKKISFGIDSYAVQTFNNAPDGKVYGVSWSASWKTVSEYESLRENYNGGLTLVCEYGLESTADGYELTKNPVSGYEELRAETLYETVGFETFSAEEDPLSPLESNLAELQIKVDFNASTASGFTLKLAASAYEETLISYQKETQTLIVDRSNSSLAAKNTTLFNVVYSEYVPLQEGVLELRVLLDNAFLNVFASGGRASLMSAIFPSVQSQGMSLMSDGELCADISVYELKGVLTEQKVNDELYLSATKFDLTVGESVVVAASSLAEGYENNASCTYTVTEGTDVVRLQTDADGTVMEALKSGAAKISVSFGEKTKIIEVYVYENGFQSNLDFPTKWGGFSYVKETGLYFSTGTSDAFLFSDKEAEDFSYTATFTPQENAQAAALVFDVTENLTGYYVVTYDLVQQKLKLWQSGIGDLYTETVALQNTFTLTASLSDKVLRVFLNDGATPVFTYKISGYDGGSVALNVYNGAFIVNNVYLNTVETKGSSATIGEEDLTVIHALDTTDNNRVLTSSEYTVEGNTFTLLSGRADARETELKLFTDRGVVYAKVKTPSPAISVTADSDEIDVNDGLLFYVGDIDVSKVTVNGLQVEYSLSDGYVTVSAQALATVKALYNTVRVYAGEDMGTFSIRITGEYVKPTYPVAKIYSIVGLSLMGGCIVSVGAAFVLIQNKRKKKNPDSTAEA